MRRFSSGESEQNVPPRAARPHSGQERGEGGALGRRVIVEEDADVPPVSHFAQRRQAHQARRSRPERARPSARCVPHSSRAVRSPAPRPPAISMLSRPAGTADALERFAQAFEHGPRLKNEPRAASRSTIRPPDVPERMPATADLAQRVSRSVRGQRQSARREKSRPRAAAARTRRGLDTERFADAVRLEQCVSCRPRRSPRARSSADGGAWRVRRTARSR